MKTEIVEAKEFGIEEQKANDLTKGLKPILEERESLIHAFEDVSQLEVNEENIPTFKELRLKIVKNRTQGINKWHKASKEFFLAGGRFVDAIKNKEIQVNEQMESKLLEGEKHFENLEKERVAKLQLERAEKLSKYVEDISHIDLGNMESDIWDAYFNAKKNEYEKRIEEENKAEEERIEKERKEKIYRERLELVKNLGNFFDFESLNTETSEVDFSTLIKDAEKSKYKHDQEQAKIRKENERLKKEREAAEEKRLAEEKKRKDAEAKKEAEHKAQLKKEREARERLERQEKERKESEAKKLAEEKAEKERLEKAPIKEKLNKWVNDFEIPETSVDNEVSKEIIKKFEAFKKWSINQVNNL